MKGIKINHFFSKLLSVIKWSKIKKSNNERINKKKEIIKFNLIDKPKTLSPSLSDFGKLIANSYLPARSKEINEAIEINIVKTPKSSGVYNLLIISEAAIEINWAIAVPETRVNTFLLNSDFIKLFINFSCNLNNKTIVAFKLKTSKFTKSSIYININLAKDC